MSGIEERQIRRNAYSTIVILDTDLLYKNSHKSTQGGKVFLYPHPGNSRKILVRQTNEQTHMGQSKMLNGVT